MKTPFQAATSSGSASISARADSTVMISSESSGTSAASTRSVKLVQRGVDPELVEHRQRGAGGGAGEDAGEERVTVDDEQAGIDAGVPGGEVLEDAGDAEDDRHGADADADEVTDFDASLVGGGLAEQDGQRLLGAGVADAAQGGGPRGSS